MRPRLSMLLPLAALGCNDLEIPDGAFGAAERAGDSEMVVYLQGIPECEGRTMSSFPMDDGALVGVGFWPAQDMVVQNRSDFGDNFELERVYLFTVDGEGSPHLSDFDDWMREGEVEMGVEEAGAFRWEVLGVINDHHDSDIICL